MKYIFFLLVVTVAFYSPGKSDEDDVVKAISDGLQKASDFNDKISDIAVKFISKINDKVDDFIDKLRRANIFLKAKEIAGKIDNIATDVVETNKDVVSSILKSLSDVVQEVADVVEEIIKEATDDAKSIAKAVSN